MLFQKTNVWKFANALKNNDPETFGEKMFESHFSLSKIMKFLELLDNIKKSSPNILGGRLTGAVGGCCIFNK